MSNNQVLIDYIDDPYYDDPPPRRSALWRRLRNTIFALVMIAALLGGMLIPAWQFVPEIMGWWSDEYTLLISSVSSSGCLAAGNPFLYPTNEMCVCGFLDAGQGNAHINFHIRPESGGREAILRVREQSTGNFCQRIPTDELLEPGEYTLIVTPRLSNETITGIRFQIRPEGTNV